MAITTNSITAPQRAFTFVKVGDDGKTVLFRDTNVTSRLGQAELTISTSPKGRGAGASDQFEMRITIPQLKATTTVSGDGYTPGPRVSHSQFIKVTGTMPVVGSEAENVQAVETLFALLAKTEVMNCFAKAVKVA